MASANKTKLRGAIKHAVPLASTAERAVKGVPKVCAPRQKHHLKRVAVWAPVHLRLRLPEARQAPQPPPTKVQQRRAQGAAKDRPVSRAPRWLGPRAVAAAAAACAAPVGPGAAAPGALSAASPQGGEGRQWHEKLQHRRGHLPR